MVALAMTRGRVSGAKYRLLTHRKCANSRRPVIVDAYIEQQFQWLFLVSSPFSFMHQVLRSYLLFCLRRWINKPPSWTLTTRCRNFTSALFISKIPNECICVCRKNELFSFRYENRGTLRPACGQWEKSNQFAACSQRCFFVQANCAWPLVCERDVLGHHLLESRHASYSERSTFSQELHACGVACNLVIRFPARNFSEPWCHAEYRRCV